MRLDEVSLISCWIVVDDTWLLDVAVSYVFPASKSQEAFRICSRFDDILEKLDLKRSVDAIQFKTENGLHLVLVGKQLPDDIPFASYTRKACDEWIKQRQDRMRFKSAINFDVIEIDPDSSSDTEEEMVELLKQRLTR